MIQDLVWSARYVGGWFCRWRLVDYDKHQQREAGFPCMLGFWRGLKRWSSVSISCSAVCRCARTFCLATDLRRRHFECSCNPSHLVPKRCLMKCLLAMRWLFEVIFVSWAMSYIQWLRSKEVLHQIFDPSGAGASARGDYRSRSRSYV